jgi:hypothetical protein
LPRSSSLHAVFAGHFALGKFHAQFDQLGDARRALPDDGAHDAFLAQARAGRQRVAHVQLDRVLLAGDGGDAALRVIGVGFRAVFLVMMATRPRGATFSANVSPAMPLPRTM